MKPCIRLTCLVALLGSLTGCSSSWFTVWVESHQRLELSPADVDQLAVTTHNGRIFLAGAQQTDGKIVVEITKRAGGLTHDDAQACMDAMQINTDRAGQTQQLGWEFEPHKHATWRGQVSFDVTLPAELAVEATSHNGRIELADIRGDCAVETHNGRITATGLEGECNLTTHNGRIEARTTAKKIRAETHNGTVAVSAAPTEVRLISHNGSIRADLNSPGDLSGTIQTYNGSVSVALGEATSTGLACSTHNGRITCKRALTDAVVSRASLVGHLGKSDARLEIITHNGRIDVR